MRITIPTLAVLTLALTGCGQDTVDSIDADATRAEKDEVFTTYVRDTYGDTLGEDEEALADLPQGVLLVCSMLGDGMSASTSIETLGLNDMPQEDQDMLLDVLYQGTRVYCPQHTDSVEWMNAGGAQ